MLFLQCFIPLNEVFHFAILLLFFGLHMCLYLIYLTHFRPLIHLGLGPVSACVPYFVSKFGSNGPLQLVSVRLLRNVHDFFIRASVYVVSHHITHFVFFSAFGNTFQDYEHQLDVQGTTQERGQRISGELSLSFSSERSISWHVLLTKVSIYPLHYYELEQGFSETEHSENNA